MDTNIKVASYDTSEASLEKTPKTYEEFMYDNETGGGVLALFDDASTLIGQVKKDISELHHQYKVLMGLYDEFYYFNGNMNRIIETMNNNVTEIEGSFKNILTTCQQAVGEVMGQDKTLMDDLDGINSLLNTGSLNNNSTRSGHNGMPSDVEEKLYGKKYTDEQLSKGKIQGLGDPGSIGGPTSNSNLADVAEEVIRGKYGVGQERIDALTAEGYDAREVQNIVNQKLKGIYNPEENTPQSGNEVVTPNVDVPSSNPTIPTKPTDPTVPQQGDISPGTPAPNTTPTAGPNQRIPTTQTLESTGNTYLDQINQIRVQRGLNPLKLDNTLTSAAQIRAQEASQVWSHVRPDGTNWNTVSSKTTGENLAFSTDPQQNFVNDWMNSKDHQDILLADDISMAGLSLYEANGKYYLALEVA